MMHAITRSWGHAVGTYARKVVSDRAVERILDAPLPKEPTIWIGWHEANLVTIALHRLVLQRPVVAFVPGGLKGAAVLGWLDALDVGAVPIGGGVSAGAALQAMRRALRTGHDVMIAADGPDGPRRAAKPGALWLARALGRPVAPVGCAAWPALRLPRWDRHIVPLPAARIPAIFGEPIDMSIDPRSPEAARLVANTLDTLMQRASDRLGDAQRPNETRRLMTWKVH